MKKNQQDHMAPSGKQNSNLMKSFLEKADSTDENRIDAHRLFSFFTESVIKLRKRFVR